MKGLLITVYLDGSLVASEVGFTDAESESTARLMSVVEPQPMPIRRLILEAPAARRSPAA
jgi:hypothetical protein